MRHVFIGTSGYSYKDWKGRFYPNSLTQTQWLAFYAKYFATVEINATFYGHFKPNVFQNWYTLTPSHFRFALKGPRLITHVKRLKGINDALVRFFDNAQPLREKLAVVLWQFPASFIQSPENEVRLKAFLERLPMINHQVVEFRHPSWFTNQTRRLLNFYQTGFVINDTNAFPTQKIITANTAYLRFHGPTTLYASSYSEKQLKLWAEKIRTFREHYDVYCYFNNDASGFAVENAKMLQGLLES